MHNALFCSDVSQAMRLSIVTITTVCYVDIYPAPGAAKPTIAIRAVSGTMRMAIPLDSIGSCFSDVWKRRDRILRAQILHNRFVQHG